MHRLTGWLVEQGRRADAEAVMRYAAAQPGPFPRVLDDGPPRLDVSVVDGLDDVPFVALALRSYEV